MNLDFLSDDHSHFPKVEELCKSEDISLNLQKSLTAYDLVKDAKNKVLLIDENWLEQHTLPSGNQAFKDLPTIALLTSKGNSESIGILNRHGYLSHVISYVSEDFDEIFKTLKVCFDSKKYSLPEHWAQEPKSLVMRTSSERGSAYEKVSEYAENLGAFGEFPNIVETISSELITNAFYDAPRDKNDEPIQPCRNSEVTLHPPSFVEFKFGVCNNNYLWINATDPFGTFTKEKIISSLYRASSERRAIINQKGGAGMGLLMMLNWSSAMYFFLDEKQQTSVWCKVRITRRQKVFHKQQSSLMIFCNKDRLESAA